MRLRLAALSKSRVLSSSLDFPVGAWTYIRSTSTPHRNLTTIHRCWGCSLRLSLLNACAEISSVRVPRVVKVGHRFFCDNIKLSQSSASWRPGNMTPTVSLSPRAPCKGYPPVTPVAVQEGFVIQFKPEDSTANVEHRHNCSTWQ